MNRGRYAAYSALRLTLLSINGASGGYWNDWTDHVHETLITPEDPAEMPTNWWACMPLLGDTETFDEEESDATRALWVQRLFLFASGSAADPVKTTALERLCKLIDDVHHKLKEDPTLNRRVHGVRVVTQEPIAAVDLEDDAAEVMLLLRITQIFDASDLRSDA
jgi:hypothetical protein